MDVERASIVPKRRTRADSDRRGTPQRDAESAAAAVFC